MRVVENNRTQPGRLAMHGLLESLGKLLGSYWKHHDPTRRHSRTFVCRCGKAIFFDNCECPACHAPLAYLPEAARLLPLEPGRQPGCWQVAGDVREYRFCGNRDLPARCNWLRTAVDPNPLCIACRLNRTIPDLGDEENARRWGLIEVAKRRMVSQLLVLGLPLKSKVDEDTERGLMFDFLRSPPDGPRVLTGHAHGLITLNIEEADDVKREQIRRAMHEPYRTLLGHFRHEIGHYYWDRLIGQGPWLERFRARFGDERSDYALAMQAHYAKGQHREWDGRFISLYAAAHPLEDWAETWAHYLHMIDSLGTALGFGLDAGDIEGRIEPFEHDALHDPDDPGADGFLALVNAWIEMTMVLNELARSMGQPDFYPFVMPRPAVAKLQFVHLVIEEAATSVAGRDSR